MSTSTQRPRPRKEGTESLREKRQRQATKRGVLSTQTQGADRGVQTRDSESVRWSDAWAQGDPAAGRTEEAQSDGWEGKGAGRGGGGGSLGVCLSIPHWKAGHRGAAAPGMCPGPLGSAVRQPPGPQRIPMPAVCS